MRTRNPDFAKQVLKKDRVCQECGATENLQAHHIIPFSVGGADTLENGEALCPSCHANRHPGVPYELFFKREKSQRTVRTSINIPDELEVAARAKCQELDLNLSQVIRRFLRKWTRGTDGVMYVYIRSEPELWTVGFYSPDGNWYTDSDHTDRNAARERVRYLNGGESNETPSQAVADESQKA